MGRLWHVPGAVTVLLAVGAPLLTWVRILGPSPGFSAFFAGVALAAVSGLGLAAAGAFASATGRAWRGAAVRAAALPLLVTLAVLLPNLGAGQKHPIHDVTTDPEDTLLFAPEVARLRPDEPREEVLAAQQELYPDIGPLVRAARPDRVLERATEVARSRPDWRVLSVHGERSRIEALATSRIFGFQDDIVIRVRAHDGGSRVDMRSRSRMGQSDLGANSARIRAYLADLSRELE